MCNKKNYFYYVLVFITPTILFTNYVLNHIYLIGSEVFDTGWFTYLSTNNLSFPLKNPPILGLTDTFFSTHIALFFYILSFIYTFFESFLSPQIYFSVFIGIMYGIISLSIFIAFKNLVNNKYILITALFSIAAPFNASAIALIGFPHIEIAISAFIILFFSLYMCGYKKISYIVFILLISIREDAGFHFFGILFVIFLFYIVLNRKIKGFDKELLIIISISFLYSLCTIIIQKYYFVGDDTLRRVYLGIPLFSHINKEFIVQGVKFIYHYREYIYIPYIFLIICAVYTKNIYLAVMNIAVIPLSILLFFAFTIMPHQFSNYYPFLYIVLSAWSVLGFLLYKYFTKKDIEIKKIFITYFLVTILSIFLYDGKNNLDSNPYKNLDFKYTKSYKNIEHLKKQLVDNSSKFGILLFDDSFASVNIENIKKSQFAYNNQFFHWQKESVDTIIFYKNTIADDKVQKVIKNIVYNRKLIYVYNLKNTNIIIASKHILDFFDKDKLSKIDLISFLEYKEKVFTINEISTQVGYKKDNKIIAKQNQKGFLTYGPYIKVYNGYYQFKLNYSTSYNSSQSIGKWEVLIHSKDEAVVLNSGIIYGNKNSKENLSKSFYVPKDYDGKYIEIRTYYNGQGDLDIHTLTLKDIYNNL